MQLKVVVSNRHVSMNWVLIEIFTFTARKLCFYDPVTKPGLPALYSGRPVNSRSVVLTNVMEV